MVNNGMLKRDGTKVVRKYRPAVLCLLLLAVGCNTATKPTNQNFIKALNLWYADRNECLFDHSLQFPYEASENDKSETGGKAMDALESGGLLKRMEDRGLKEVRYTLTPFGARATTRFCYGHREVTSIVDASAPQMTGGMKTVQVHYRYKLMDVPLWAKEDKVMNAFPKMAKAIGGENEGTDALVQTLVGWQRPE